jgi:hypothetical protein
VTEVGEPRQDPSRERGCRPAAALEVGQLRCALGGSKRAHARGPPIESDFDLGRTRREHVAQPVRLRAEAGDHDRFAARSVPRQHLEHRRVLTARAAAPVVHRQEAVPEQPARAGGIDRDWRAEQPTHACILARPFAARVAAVRPRTVTIVRSVRLSGSVRGRTA